MNIIFIDHLFYADDSVLMAPSAYSLQVLLDICQNYAKNHDVKYNERKTVTMTFKPNCKNNIFIPEFILNGRNLQYVNFYKYLGVIISSDFSDDEDVLRIRRFIYSSGNSMVLKFDHVIMYFY